METSPQDNPDTYRLYIDESGDHVFKHLEDPNHRYLCILGCWMKTSDIRVFHERLEGFKQRCLPHNPDEPINLHREDIINRRRSFSRLRDPSLAAAFDDGLIEEITRADFTMVAVLIDKKSLEGRFPQGPGHPYHLAMGFLLQRYCGYLNHINRHGDVMAESRGGTEDRRLKDSHDHVYERGVWHYTKPETMQRALTSRQLKLKPKSANIAGLQLADLLAHPIKQSILLERALMAGPLAPFATRIIAAAGSKFNKHLYNGKVAGYGKVFYPA